MRLKKFEVQIIKKAIHSLEPDVAIYLFGSRADDSKKGGDIDLLIFSRKIPNLLISNNGEIRLTQKH